LYKAHLQAVLSELSSLQLAIKLLYSELISFHVQNEVRSHPVEIHCETSLSPIWCSVEPEFIKMNNQAGRPEIVQSAELVKIVNIFAPLSTFLDCRLGSDDSVLRDIRRMDQITSYQGI
jgi:hypothetical protein